MSNFTHYLRKITNEDVASHVGIELYAKPAVINKLLEISRAVVDIKNALATDSPKYNPDEIEDDATVVEYDRLSSEDHKQIFKYMQEILSIENKIGVDYTINFETTTTTFKSLVDKNDPKTKNIQAMINRIIDTQIQSDNELRGLNNLIKRASLDENTKAVNDEVFRLMILIKFFGLRETPDDIALINRTLRVNTEKSPATKIVRELLDNLINIGYFSFKG